MKLHWQNELSTQEEPDDKRLHDLLFQRGSLSRSIEDSCRGTFNIELKNESWSDPMSDENQLLSLIDNETTFIRESWLKCDNKRLVYARTVIPRITFE
ncbi:MAG: chorismate-pyruvate lyase, partial [Gammaproteobacteria bacterium]